MLIYVSVRQEPVYPVTCLSRFQKKKEKIIIIIKLFYNIFILSHTIVARYYGLALDVCVSVRPSVHFSFPDDYFSKHQWIFTKFGMCIDIMEIWFGIANRQISSNIYSYQIMAGYYSLMFLFAITMVLASAAG